MASNSIRGLYKLYVGNIPWTVNSSELKKYFSKYGSVVAANVIFDKNTGISKRYGFVTFNNREGFEKASSTNHLLEGNSLKISKD